MRNSALSLIFVALSLVCLAQPNRFRFHSYGEEEGLNSSTVNHIAEDANGFIWIGTEDGLVRFDAYDFKTYRKTNSQHQQLPSNSITAILTMWDGKMLVGTRSGLVLFDSKKEQFEAVWEQAEQVRVSAIAQRDSSHFWIGTRSGLFLLDLDSHGFERFQYVPESDKSISSDEIIDLLIDTKGTLWISTLNGLNRYLPETRGFKKYWSDKENPSAISSNVLRQLSETQEGNLLVGTATDGLNLMTEESDQGTFVTYSFSAADPFSLSAQSAYSSLVDLAGNVWIGTWSSGLNLIDLKTGKAQRYYSNPNNAYSIPQNSVKTLFESSTGDLWIGTANGGLARMSPSEEQVVRFQYDETNNNSPKTSHIRSVYEDQDGILWIGTAQEGLHKYNPLTNDFEFFIKSDGSKRARSRGSIWAISEGQNQDLWLGTSIGLARFSKTTNAIEFFEPDENNTGSISSNNILSVLNDGKGSVWAGTWNGGLNKLDIETGNFETFKHDKTDSTSLAGNTITEIFQDSKGQVWIDAGSLLHLFDASTKSFKRFDIDSYSIAEDTTGMLWIASGDGLIRFDPKELIYSRVTVSGTALDAPFRSIEIDFDQNIWLGSKEGILCYDPKSQSVISQLDKDQGLAGNNLSPYVSDLGQKSGKLYVGGIDGLSQIDPSTARSKQKEPVVVLTDFLLFNKSVTVSDSSVLQVSVNSSEIIELEHDDYIFAFEFSALSYSQPKHIKYQYKLEGFDQQWIETDYLDRKAVYTNVTPGKYTFKVRSSDLQGNWLDNQKNVTVRVIPPWWQTVWARVAFFIAVLALTILIFRVRLSFLKKRKVILEKQVKERSSEILNQKRELEKQAQKLIKANDQKNKMFSIIAHDLKAPLNTLMGIVPLLSPEILGAEDLKRIKNDLSHKLGTIDTSMSNLLGWAKSQLQGEVIQKKKLSLDQMIEHKLSLYSPYAKTKKIELRSVVQEEIMISADENLLRTIFRNLLSNAIKFTDFEGQIVVEVETNEELATVSISDSGIGIPKEKITELFEVKNAVSLGTGGEQGVGLGLVVVKDFVEKNGGRIWVESEVSKGSTFYFTIALA